MLTACPSLFVLNSPVQALLRALQAPNFKEFADKASRGVGVQAFQMCGGEAWLDAPVWLLVGSPTPSCSLGTAQRAEMCSHASRPCRC